MFFLKCFVEWIVVEDFFFLLFVVKEVVNMNKGGVWVFIWFFCVCVFERDSERDIEIEIENVSFS